MTKYEVLMKTATDKYAKLVDAAYKLRDGAEVDCEKLVSLVHSIYMDEANLIFELCCQEEQHREEKQELQIPVFMCNGVKRRR